MPPLKTHWIQRAGLPRFRRLTQDLNVDVVVVGAGITGITAAYLLKKAGKTVALLERGRCARVDTAHTTAHLTYVTDTRISELVRTFGKDHAQAAWDAGRAAMLQIRSVIEEAGIDCDFATVPAYLHAPWKQGADDDFQRLKEDASLATELGFDAEFLKSVAFANRPGVRFANQAKFHPLRYLAALLSRIPGDGSYVYEQSEVTEFQTEPLGVTCNDCNVRGDYLIIATHVPMMGNAGFASATLFQSKLAAYSSYAVGAKLPKGILDEALFWDTDNPYHYLRLDSHGRYDYVILGGEDDRTGQEDDTNACLERLEDMLHSILPSAKVDAHWSGQVIETPDGLPYCGETAEHQFAATGFAGNGMTFGTLAAMMGVDAALGQVNPWRDLFDPNRKVKTMSTVADYLKRNIDYPYYLVKDKLAAAEGQTLEEVENGTGKVLKLNGRRVAAYRDASGHTTILSASCTHMGCVVHWNKADATWDCPCHGSRFKGTGEVLAGPAESPLDVLQEASTDSLPVTAAGDAAS